MATCPHASAADIRPPKPSDNVYREDCTVCFDSIDDAPGLDVCLHCFNGGCCGERIHGRLHAQQAGHPLAVNIRRTRKRKQRAEGEPPEKISKLAIKAETEEEKYDTRSDVHCYECGVGGIAKEGKVGEVVDGVLKANTFAKQEEVKAWEQEMTACEHTLCLEQEPPRQIPSGDLGHCTKCDLKENLWLCLACGNLGCGRTQWGGTGGNNHGVEHTKESNHPVAVKLGSLTADGNADIYCYACDEERVDRELVTHLQHWGINIADRVKTEKSITEMQIEQNLTWEFRMVDEKGQGMKPLFGAGFTGLKNLGNSCYLASVLQSLFAMPEFAHRYYRPDEMIPPIAKPAEDLEVQLRKVADGLLSGRYGQPGSDVQASEEVPEQPWQSGLAPAMLKHLIGRGHSEFSTMRQQDGFELLLHLLKLVTRSQAAAQGQYKDVSDPVEAFRFCMEQKLKCLGCGKVKLRTDEMENLSIAVPIKRLPQDASAKSGGDNDEESKEEFEPVTLRQCIDEFTAAEHVELNCAGCGNKGFTKQQLFKTFPTIFAVNARRFEIVNWVPTKQDVPVIVDEEDFDLEAYRSPGKLPDEEELPEDQDAGSGASAAFVPNEMALEMLMSMGFPKVRCERALHATGNQDPEAATQWLFEHMEDPDIDTPLSAPGGGGAGNASADPEKVENLGMMGFAAPVARQALKETGGDMERAVDWLFSHPDAQGISEDAGGSAETTAAPDSPGKMEVDNKPAHYSLKSIVCHKGSSIHAGHYVAFVRKNVPDPAHPDNEEWVLFNDEKVALGADAEEMKKFAYIYFFRRKV
ncbi:ubiquitin thiolesterase [Hortaea werneckii]|nr:ubiquitin thiolesterase [Hortaea werneckii]